MNKTACQKYRHSSWGSNTEFADMRAIYDALDERLRQEIEDLVCHSNKSTYKNG